MNKLQFTSHALCDIEDIVMWYEFRRIGLSYDFELCLEAGLGEIARNPELFQKKYKNIKIRFISRFSYGIHYLLNENTVINIGVFHTSRTPKNWSKRLNL